MQESAQIQSKSYNNSMKKQWELLPQDFLDRMELLIPEPYERNEILSHMIKRRPTTLRVNTLKTTQNELTKLLQEYSIPFSKVSWYDDAFIIPDFPLLEITKLPFYQNGLCYVQGLSSMIPVLVLSPQPNSRVLDIAAAPGSKTTQIACLMNNQGEITANDTSRIRTFKLQANLERQGVAIANITQTAAQRIWQMYPESFNSVLADVPCSMEGRFLASDYKSFIDWTPKKVKILASEQAWILRSAISACQVGGSIVYSTCTLSPEENEGVLDWILKKEKDAVTLEPISLPIPDAKPGIQTWRNKQFDPRVRQAVRIYPTQHMEGFFVASIKKLKNTVNEENFSQSAI